MEGRNGGQTAEKCEAGVQSAVARLRSRPTEPHHSPPERPDHGRSGGAGMQGRSKPHRQDWLWSTLIEFETINQDAYAVHGPRLSLGRNPPCRYSRTLKDEKLQEHRIGGRCGKLQYFDCRKTQKNFAVSTSACICSDTHGSERIFTAVERQMAS